MPRDEIVFNTLFEQAKKCIIDGDLDAFKVIVGKKYKEKVSVSEDIKVTKGSFELGLYDEWDTVTREIEVDTDYFTSNDYKQLFVLAYQNNSLPILKWFFEEKGKRFTQDCFVLFCKKNASNNSPELEKICELQMSYALQRQDISFATLILEQSPVFKDNPQLVERLRQGVFPLIKNLVAINRKAATEIDSWTRMPLDSSKVLTSFSSEVHQLMTEYVTGQINSKNFVAEVEKKAQTAMDTLEKESEGWRMVKNFFLKISLIGPYLKEKFVDGVDHFENSTTVKVREMKESLAQLKLAEKLPQEQHENTADDQTNLEGGINIGLI